MQQDMYGLVEDINTQLDAKADSIGSYYLVSYPHNGQQCYALRTIVTLTLTNSVVEHLVYDRMEDFLRGMLLGILSIGVTPDEANI